MTQAVRNPFAMASRKFKKKGSCANAFYFGIIVFSVVALVGLICVYVFIPEGAGWSNWWPLPFDVNQSKQVMFVDQVPEIHALIVFLAATLVVISSGSYIQAFNDDPLLKRFKFFMWSLLYFVYSVGVCMSVVQSLKISISEKRPDFYARCYGMKPVKLSDANQVADAKVVFKVLDDLYTIKKSDKIATTDCLSFQTTDLQMDTDSPGNAAFGRIVLKDTDADSYLKFLNTEESKDERESEILDGRKSFPSGHSASAAWMATTTFLFTVWVIYKKRSVSSGILLIFTTIFVVYCGWVMYTRVADHKHHWWDVVAGCGLGVLFASVFFSLWAIFVAPQAPGKNDGKDDKGKVEVTVE
eukprot:263818_1